jgi:hypothetical protein
VTFDLPSDYTAGDSDGDNQLGLNEWTAWKSRSAMREFLSLDADNDGFLTPVELGASGSSSSRSSTEEMAAAGPGRDSTPPYDGGYGSGEEDDDDGDGDRSQGRRDDNDRSRGEQNGGDQNNGNGGSGAPQPAAPPAAPAVSLEDFEFDSNSAQAKGAVNDFGLMDKNDDGKLNAEEWASSRRIRPLFVDAGIDISGEMSQDEYVKTYLWIRSQQQQ